jgi:hypothetical protein
VNLTAEETKENLQEEILKLERYNIYRENEIRLKQSRVAGKISRKPKLCRGIQYQLKQNEKCRGSNR